MCTIENLELSSKALYPIRYLVSVYLLVAGWIICGNMHLSQAFGYGMRAIGAFLIVCSVWNFAAATIMRMGVRRHNKFIIFAALLLDFALAGIQLTLGSSMYSRTLPEFSEDMQQDCLLKVPAKYTTDECLEYTRSDRYAGMMLAWRSYAYLSLEYTKYYQRLVTIQQDGRCCGFGPPTRCTGDSRDFPNGFSKSKVGFSSDKRYVCGKEENWYDENYFCSQEVDETLVFTTVGGCKYDFPMGDCKDIDVDVSDTVQGCAFALETHMTDKIFVHSLAIMGLSSFIFASVLSGCCMCWKRAYDDSLPDYVDRHVPWDPYKDKELGRMKNKNRRAKRGGEDSPHLDPLGVLIMGKMPEIKHGSIVPV